MVVIATGYMLFVTSQYDVIFTFANKVLAKFVDTMGMFSDAGTVVGGAVKQFMAMETYKEQKNLHQQCSPQKY